MIYPTKQPKIIVIALSLCFASGAAFADTQAGAEQSTVNNGSELETIRVKAKKRVNRRTQEVTGLGKIVKSSKQLEKEQVLNIRDLVRYDPGVSVVEQGRGGSSGFSIRGVDKNRVMVSVDGIPQVQSYADTTSSSGGSGSMNEIEYENVSAVEISKGSNSVESGSGGLGGSVSYHTKNTDDFIDANNNWGFTSKSVYSSKDRRFAQTVGGAFRSNGVEGLLQYTHRKGHETDIHKDAGNLSQSFYRQDAYEDKYDLRYEANRLSDNLFRFENEPDQIRNRAAATRADLWQPSGRTQPYTPEEEAQRTQAMRHTKETLSPSEYTGENRIKPNPMEYQSGSWLGRLGYRSADHYIGYLGEHTRQQYDSRDMRYPAYHTPFSKPSELDRLGKPPVIVGDENSELKHANNSNGLWRNNPREGFAFLLWNKSRFLEEDHKRARHGLSYRYQPLAGSKWADSVEVNLDRQQIQLNTATIYAHCAPYPDYSSTLNCQPSLDKPGSYLNREDVAYKENHWLINGKWNKKWKFNHGTHDVSVSVGYDRFDSSFNKDISETSVFKRQTKIATEKRMVNGQERSVDVYRDLGAVMRHEKPCTDWNLDTCSRKPITGNSYHIALRDNISSKYLDLSFGLRLDRHSFKSDDTAIRNKDYNNRSWNLGAVFKPTERWALSYRIANGFRVPSFQELFGYNLPGVDRNSKYHYIADLEPEKSLNQEFGLTYKGYFTTWELSAFNSRYRDLIAYGITKQPYGSRVVNGIRYRDMGNFNVQNADLNGVNFRANIDLHGMWDKMPDGLGASFAYSHVKASRLFNHNPERFDYLADYPLETIQPSRYVLGVNYDSPNDKWGVSVNMIHSRGKNPDELISKVHTGSGNNFSKAATKGASKPWTTFDLIGYYRPWKNATLRLGVYNLMNYRYLTWETMRQGSINALSQQKTPGSDYKQFAAPGRNFTLGLEVKF